MIWQSPGLGKSGLCFMFYNMFSCEKGVYQNFDTLPLPTAKFGYARHRSSELDSLLSLARTVSLFICRRCLLSFVHRLSGAASKPTPGRQVDFRQVGLQSVLSRGIRELAEYSGRGSDPLAGWAIGQVRSRDIRADRSFSLSVVDYIVSGGKTLRLWPEMHSGFRRRSQRED